MEATCVDTCWPVGSKTVILPTGSGYDSDYAAYAQQRIVEEMRAAQLTAAL